MWTSTVPDTHKFPTDARIRIAPHPMHGNGRICEHSPHMCGSAYITDAKDVQIAIANVGMTRARGFGRQTPETGFRFVAGVKVKMIYIYIYIYIYIKWTVFVNVTTKSAQHAHARMIAIIVEKSPNSSHMYPYDLSLDFFQQLYIYIYICTHFATSSHIHILLGVLSLSPQHFVINPARHKLRFECLK